MGVLFNSERVRSEWNDIYSPGFLMPISLRRTKMADFPLRDEERGELALKSLKWRKSYLDIEA